MRLGRIPCLARNGGNMRSDSEVRRDVEMELRDDPDVDSTDIPVAVKDGVVTLTGFVHHYNEKTQAEKAAKRVHGVKGAANDIEVRLPDVDQRPDPEIARDAVAALKHQLPTAWERIKVSVSAGTIALEGDVEWHYQSEVAERMVRPLKGVTGVKNRIRIVPKAMPREIKWRIEEAFQRSAEVDAAHVTVEASGGEVILKGTVRSWAEREEAERAAWAVPGVASVDNQIVVRA
jgi:osmotically-inducible protein OsmY